MSLQGSDLHVFSLPVPGILIPFRLMIRWANMGRRVMFAGVCLLGCGSANESKGLFEPLGAGGSADAAPPEQAPPVIPPPDAGSEVMVPEPPPPAEEMPPPASTICKPPPGVSGAPETISEAIALLSALPKPTSLACFIEALDRPLTLYMTKSYQSLQPSPGARSPRTFILRGNLEMSIVLDGSASNTLEFGFRSEPSRSIKAEVLFPRTTDVTESSLFDRVQVTPRTTKCGACHVGEAHEDFPGFPLGVFNSDVLAPFELDEVSLDALRAEGQSCDAAAEPYRCGLLSALLDHGELVQGLLRGRDD
jgi:hypothetical protein